MHRLHLDRVVAGDDATVARGGQCSLGMIFPMCTQYMSTNGITSSYSCTRTVVIHRRSTQRRHRSKPSKPQAQLTIIGRVHTLRGGQEQISQIPALSDLECSRVPHGRQPLQTKMPMLFCPNYTVKFYWRFTVHPTILAGCTAEVGLRMCDHPIAPPNRDFHRST